MKSLIIATTLCLFTMFANASSSELDKIKNYQQLTPQFASAGLPTNEQLTSLKQNGFTHIINLIPGDFSEEASLSQQLELGFKQIPVDWHNPTMDDYMQFVDTMTAFKKQNPDGKILLHCQLNYRASAFAYLYQVTQNKQNPAQAKAVLNQIWQPEGKWQQLIDEVIAANK